MRTPLSGSGSSIRHRALGDARAGLKSDAIVLAGEGRFAVRTRPRLREILRQHRRIERRIADRHGRERAARAIDILRQQLIHCRHHRERNPQCDALLEPLHRGLLHQHRLDDRGQLVRMRVAIRRRRIARIGTKLGQADHHAEGVPLRGCHHRDAKPAFFGFEIADRKSAPETIDADARPREAGFQRQSRIEFADLQQSLVSADSVTSCALLTAEQSGQARDERRERCDDSDLAVARQHRRAFDRADEFDDAREAAAHRIRDAIIAIRAVFAEPRDRGDRERRIVAAQIVMREL